MAFLPVIAMAATAIGAGVTAFGQYQQGQAASAMARYQQAVALQNADYERRIGETRAMESGMQAQERLGMIRAAAGGGGLDPNVGSPQQIYESQRSVAQFGEGIIRADAARKAYALSTQADIYGFSAKESAIAGDISAAGTIASGIGKVASMWLTPGFGGGATTSPGVAIYNTPGSGGQIY